MASPTKHLGTILTAALALASVALLFFLLRGRAPAPDAPRSTQEPASPPRAAPTRSPGAAPTSSSERAPALAPGTAELAPGVRAPVAVVIVRADTREPVPEAQVWSWPCSPVQASDGDFEEWLRAGRIEEHLPSALETRADSLGRVALADHEAGFVVAAASGELWGFATFGPLREGPALVALARDVELRVQVVDAEGNRLAGVPVALAQRRGPARFERLFARTAGPEGIAVLRHASPFLRTQPGFDGEFVVAVEELFDPPLERALDPGALPAEQIRFALRPNGSCRVALVDASGASIGGAFEARLSFAETAAPAARRSESRRSRGSGEVLFEHVELGRTLLVEVAREGSSARLEARAAGPRNPGEEVQLRLPVEGDSAILRGRVLDAAGAPLGARELCARIEEGQADPAARQEWRLWTGADGRFALQTAPRAALPAGAQFALAALAPEGAELAVARLALPPELRAGSCELGDCVLRELPLAAAGEVVDDGGQPVAGALVHASLADRALPSARTDEAGHFAIRGEAAGQELWLSAEKSGLAGDPLAVRAPAPELRLLLGRTGAIEGSVKLDASLERALVLVQAEIEALEPEPRLAGAVAAVLGPDGRFALPGLRPGSYSVRVVHAASAGTLASVAGLRVRAGQTLRDPRLDPLDLRGGQRLLELELVDERGLPVAQGRAFSRPSDEPEARWVAAEPAGTRLRILSDGRPLDVSIAAEGYFRTELERVRESRRVTLQRGAELRLELAGGVQLPEPPIQVGVELTPLEAGSAGGFGESRQAFFGPDGVLRCSISCAGALRARIVVARRGQGNAQLVHAGEAIPGTLQVAASSSLQVFSIRVDPAALAAAIEAARDGE